MPLAAWKKSGKVDNNPQAEAAKVDIRRRVLAAVGEAHVFDAFAGTGKMHAAVWSSAIDCVGCDEKWIKDNRKAFVADNRRVLRAIDLAPFNLFDLDAYGSPWEQAIIIADRRRVARAELIGFAITDGAGAAFIGNVVPAAITQLGGIKPGMVGMLRNRDAVLERVVAGLARRMNCSVVKQWQAKGKTGAAVRYVGLVLRGP